MVMLQKQVPWKTEYRVSLVKAIADQMCQVWPAIFGATPVSPHAPCVTNQLTSVKVKVKVHHVNREKESVKLLLVITTKPIVLECMILNSTFGADNPILVFAPMVQQ
jgi:hypothetical protein